MRVLTTSTCFPRWKDDYFGNFVLNASRGLANEGYDIEVLCPHYPGVAREEVVEGVKVTRFKYFFEDQQSVAYGGGMGPNLKQNWWLWAQLPFFVFSFLRAIRKYKKGKDLVHAHFLLNGFLCLLMRSRPLLVTVHQVVKNNWVNRFVLEHADGVYFNSQYTCDQSLKFCKPKKHWVLRAGIRTGFFVPKENNTPFNVVFVGRMVEKKGLPVLIEAMKGLDIPWTAIGGGTDLAKYKEDYPNNFTGVVDDATLLQYMQNAGVVVLPSIIDSGGETETLGQTLVEALSCGVPVIGSNVGGIPEVVDATVGFLVSPGDSKELRERILQLESSPELQQALRANTRVKAVREFSVEAHVEQLKKIYEEVIGDATST